MLFRSIRHRLTREKKVIRKLEELEEASLELLTKLVYDDVPEQLHPIARFSLEAHLIKLIDESIVMKKNDCYKKT